MMDRNEQTGVHAVGAGGALEQASPRRGAGDQQDRLFEADVQQGLLDVARQLQIEGVFGYAACAHRAGYLERVSDIDYDAICRARAFLGSRLARACSMILSAHALQVCRQQNGRKNNAELCCRPSHPVHVAILAEPREIAILSVVDGNPLWNLDFAPH